MQPQPDVVGAVGSGGQVVDHDLDHLAYDVARVVLAGERGELLRFDASASGSPSSGRGTRRRGRCPPSRGWRGRSPRPSSQSESRQLLYGGGPTGHWPVRPSMHSRSRSAWPTWRAYSSIMCGRRCRGPRTGRRGRRRRRRGRCARAPRARRPPRRARASRPRRPAPGRPLPRRSRSPVLVLEQARNLHPGLDHAAKPALLHARHAPHHPERRHVKHGGTDRVAICSARARRTSAPAWSGSSR